MPPGEPVNPHRAVRISAPGAASLPRKSGDVKVVPRRVVTMTREHTFGKSEPGTLDATVEPWQALAAVHACFAAKRRGTRRGAE
jgi:hypothetical protein